MNGEILFFFGEHMDALPIYERLEAWIRAWIPDVKIKVAKTQITFAGKGALPSCPSIPAAGPRTARRSG